MLRYNFKFHLSIYILFDGLFLELRTDDRRIHRPGAVDFNDRNPFQDPLMDRRFSSHFAELEELRRSTTPSAESNRRVLQPSAETNGFHPSGMY